MKLPSLICVMTAALLSSTSVFAADLKEQKCNPTSRIKNFDLPNHQVLRGDGIVGSNLHSIRVSLIEQMYEDCRISSSFVFDYIIYNHFQSGKSPGASAAMYLSMWSGGREIARNFAQFGVPLGFCGPYGTNGRPFHNEGNIRVNFFDITDEIRLTSTRISGRLGQC